MANHALPRFGGLGKPGEEFAGGKSKSSARLRQHLDLEAAMEEFATIAEDLKQ